MTLSSRTAYLILLLLTTWFLGSVHAAKPLGDLTVTSLTAPASAAPGETISIIYTVRNSGPGQANIGSTLGCTLSGPSGAMSLGTAQVPRLKVSQQFTSALSVTIPPSVLPGSYTLTLTADVSQTIQESSEVNNSRSVPLTITTDGMGAALLSWNTNPEPDVAGYKTHYGTASRQYTVHEDVGNVTTSTVASLAGGFTYFFAVSAYSLDRESGYSNEASKFIP